MLAIGFDPGETIGYAALHVEDSTLEIRGWGEFSWKDLSTLTHEVFGLLQRHQPALIILEDFRIFPGRAKEAVGLSPVTSEVIGVIEAVAALMVGPGPIPVVRRQPGEKGRWPRARLDRLLPGHTQVTGQHARDAMLVALVHLDKGGIWRYEAQAA